MAGKVYVNCMMQMAATSEVRYENWGIADGMTKAMAQYIGTMPTQSIFPFFVLRLGPPNKS